MMDDRRLAAAPAGIAPRLSGAAGWLVSGTGMAVASGLAVMTIVVFRLFPDLDIAASRAFYLGNGHFAGQTAAGDALRRVFSLVPFVLIALMLCLFLARHFTGRPSWAPSARGMGFLVLSLALGPGLLVNVVLKDHSHRPRPGQTETFGGSMVFRPVGSFDGACSTNCSFVSGEGSSTFWTVAPALLAPVASQPAALVAALCLGTGASLLRIAFGGHFLSDTIMAAALDWLVIAAVYRALLRRSYHRR